MASVDDTIPTRAGGAEEHSIDGVAQHPNGHNHRREQVSSCGGQTSYYQSGKHLGYTDAEDA